jgi:Bacterial membrane protein YfhO
VYPFSLEPFRLVEMIWPNVFGSDFGERTAWSSALPLPGTRPLLWVPSLYFGGFTLLLALSAVSLRRGPPWRTWLSAVAIVSLAGSLGQYGSPIWATRALDAVARSPALRDLTRHLGPLDPVEPGLIRADGRLRDGDGSFYWWLTQVLPGFRQFRFPSKLLVFTVLACSALGGLGWDALSIGRRRGMVILLVALLVTSLVLMACAYGKRSVILAALRAVELNTIFGPFEPAGGFAAILRALGQASIVFVLGLVAVGLVKSRPGWAGAFAVALTAADLALANVRYVVTVPQAIFDSRPQVLEIIEAAERKDPAPGPYRVHRMPAWAPLGWWVTPAVDRASELMAWENDTIQSKFGITWGIEYTESLGVGELSAYNAFFRGFRCLIRDPEAARRMQLALNRPIVYFPRRAFDLWNTRYFVVPMFPSDWNDEQRATASFVYRSDRLYPGDERFSGPDGNAEYKQWTGYHDFQVLRNDQAYPRAWIVHDARPIPTVRGTSRVDRRRCLDEMTYCHDLWREAGLQVFDPHIIAWIDGVTMRELARFLPGPAVRPNETVEVRYPDPQHVELSATLEAPGIVILSDVDYPGWELTIDGRPAPIHTVNLSMRGAAVDAGTHRLVYTYRPRSFLIGRIVSLVGLAALVVFGAICAVWPIDATVTGSL